MKNILKLLAAVSVCRERMNKYQTETKPDEIKPDKIAELAGNLTRAETELRTAIEKYEDRPEPTERRELATQIELRNYMHAARKDRAVTGKEAEYNKELGLDDRNVIPWAALAPLPEEDRADTATTVADSAIQHPRAADVLRRVFRRTRVSFLGARMPSVTSGEPVYPVMKETRATGGFPIEAYPGIGAFAPGEAVESAAAEFEGFMVSPKRISGRYTWRMEDDAKMPIESILRADLREMMGWQLDFQVLCGGLANTLLIGGTARDLSNARNFDGIFHELATAPATAPTER